MILTHLTIVSHYCFLFDGFNTDSLMDLDERARVRPTCVPARRPNFAVGPPPVAVLRIMSVCNISSHQIMMCRRNAHAHAHAAAGPQDDGFHDEIDVRDEDPRRSRRR